MDRTTSASPRLPFAPHSLLPPPVPPLFFGLTASPSLSAASPLAAELPLRSHLDRRVLPGMRHPPVFSACTATWHQG